MTSRAYVHTYNFSGKFSDDVARIEFVHTYAKTQLTAGQKLYICDVYIQLYNV